MFALCVCKILLLMKNTRLFIILIILTLALSLTFAVVPAYAEGSLSRDVYFYQGQGFGINALRLPDAERICGIIVGGYYFGGSGIEVTARIYSDDNLTIDFPINEEASKLSPSQQATQAKLIELATQMHNYIVSIDSVANTQYDGTNGLPLSDIYRYNNSKYGDTIEISEDTYNMLLIARQMYKDTNGAFNPAVYRLVDLWGFSSRVYRKDGSLPYDRQWDVVNYKLSYPLPADKYVEAFGNPTFVDFSENAVKLSQQDGKFYVTKNVKAAVVGGEEYDQWLDLGGIAKGYAVDGMRELLKESGVTRFCVDAGTSSQAYGNNYDGGDFVLFTADPYKRDFLYSPSVVGAHLSNATVSTSGQYERRYVTDGVEYAHIIDGAKGKPAQTGVKSITVIAPQSYSATMCDCLTTALTVMGRQSVVDFMNGYLKDNGIRVILTYETVDGGKQLLTNIPRSDIVEGDTFDEYAWSVKIDDDGKYAYDATAKAPKSLHDYTGWIIALGVIVIAAVVAVIVVRLLKGRRKTEQNVLNAKRDKPFKIGDVGVYLAVLLLIAILFTTFLGTEGEAVRAIKVVDFSNSSEGEVLFAYNVARNEWVVYSENTNGWTVEVTEDGNNVNVKFSRMDDGKERFNIMTITRGAKVTVKMNDATCEDKDCVYNFPALELAKRAIVCSPNRLKVITE